MSIRTAELKTLVMNELGASFEDVLEAAQVDVNRWQGSKKAFGQGADAVEGLLSHIKKDVKEEGVEEELAVYAQKYLMRAVEVLKNLRVQAEAMELKTNGKVEGIQCIVTVTKKLYDKNQQHMDALKEREAAIESGDEVKLQESQRRNRLPGTHPGLSIRHQRDDEAAAAAAESPSESMVDRVNGVSEKPKKTGRKCGRCREPGHTTRTCPKKSLPKKAKKKPPAEG
jgi:hypothetical protein